MHRVEAKLAQWKKLYLDLGEAYERLNSAVVRRGDHPSIEALRAEVERLQEESTAALEAVQAHIAAAKRRNPDSSMPAWIGERRGNRQLVL